MHHHHHHIRRQVDPFGPDLGNGLQMLEDGVKSMESNVATLVSVVYVTAAPTFQGPVGGYTTIVPVAPSQTSTIQQPSPAPLPTTAAEVSTAFKSSSVLDQSLVPASNVVPTTSTTLTNSINSSTSLLASVQVTTPLSVTQVSGQASATLESSFLGSPSVAPATVTPVVSSQGSTGLSSGAKAGVAIGVILGLVALLAMVVFYLLHRKKQKTKAYSLTEDEKDPFGDRAAAAAPVRVLTPPQPNLRLSMQPRTQTEIPILDNAHNSNVEKAQVPTDHTANPFGQHAEVSRTYQDIPAPLRVGTATPDHVPIAADAVNITATGAASATIAQRHNAPKALEIKPTVAPDLQQPMEGAIPSPACTDYSMTSLPAGAVAGGPPPNVHRIQLDFKPSMEDELELKAGQLVRLLHEYDDGWALCIRLDRSQQGVAPRTCLSARPVKPRSKPPGNALGGMRVPTHGQDGVARSISPGPYGGGPQQTVVSPGSKPRSNSTCEIHEKSNNSPGLKPVNPNTHSVAQALEGVQGAPTSAQSLATPNDTPPKRKPVPGRTV